MRYLLVFILLVFTTPALAHDPEHPELNDWYLSLNSHGGGPCCGGPRDDKSANILAEIDWRSENGHYSVRIDGKWIVVPDDRVVNIPNRDGRAIVWIYYFQGEPVVRCFLPGAGF